MLIKQVSSINHVIVIFYFYSWKKVSFISFKSINSLKNWLSQIIKMWVLSLHRWFWMIFVLVNRYFKAKFNCSNSLPLSWVDRVTKETKGLVLITKNVVSWAARVLQDTAHSLCQCSMTCFFFKFIWISSTIIS